MAIGTATALLIGAGISAATGVYKAKKAGDTADQAAAIQTESADRALGMQQNLYAPYTNVGGQAMTTLGSLMGLPTGPAGAQSGPMPNGMPEDGPRSIGDNPVIGHAQPRPDGASPVMERLGDLEPESHRTARSQTQSSLSTTVRMRSPEGDDYMDVPSELVSSFEAEGAQVVA